MNDVFAIMLWGTSWPATSLSAAVLIGCYIISIAITALIILAIHAVVNCMSGLDEYDIGIILLFVVIPISLFIAGWIVLEL